MRTTRRDVVATALAAAVVVPYVGYLAWGSLPFIHDVRGMAAVGLALGWASRVVGGRAGFGPGRGVRLAAAGGFASLGLGIAALATESELLLFVFIASIVVLWAIATRRRLNIVHGAVPQAGRA